MTIKANKNCHNRLKVRQLSLLLVALAALLSFSISAEVVRSPANFIPNDEVTVIPLEQELWIDRVMVEDDRGIFREMQQNFMRWERADTFVRAWDADEELVADYESIQDQKRYFMKNILKYVDRRISGEIKHAEKGSTMEKVGKAQKALKPQTRVTISKNVSIKFKLKLLRGRAYMNIRNPYVKSQVTMNFAGKVKMEVRKKIAEHDLEAKAQYKVNENCFEMGASKGYKRIGATAKINYNVSSGRWIASVSKTIVPNVTATISSRQKLSNFGKDSDRTAQVQYFLSF